MTSENTPPLITRPAAAAAGSAAAVVALTIIWSAKSTTGRPMYVSELGAEGEPTAGWFRAALLLIAAASFLISWAGCGRRSAVTVLAAWTIPTSIAVSGALFFVASQVPCTPGCPLPSGANALQDFTHTGSAVLAFASGAVGMLQAATARDAGTLRGVSLVCGTAMALIASAGGILSLLRVATDTGALLEFIATTVGLGWLTLFGVFVAIEGRHEDPAKASGSHQRAAAVVV